MSFKKPIPRRNLLKQVPLIGAGLLASMRADASGLQPAAGSVPPALTVEELKSLLELEPVPGYLDKNLFGSSRFSGADATTAPRLEGRPLGSCYVLITQGTPLPLHRTQKDRLYHYYLGVAVEVLLLHGDGTHSLAALGPDIKHGQHLQLLVPGGTFHAARLSNDHGWFLGAVSEWPGVLPAEIELADRSALAGNARLAEIAHGFCDET